MSADLFGHEAQDPGGRWATLFSSKSDEWPTDTAVVDDWARRVGPFSLDVSATAESAKAPRFYTLADNGLARDWVADAGAGAAWMNPPYSDCESWVAKAIAESARGLTVVGLLPSRTDTRWFHLVLAVQERCQIWFARGRLRFGEATSSAPFPSLVVVFRPERVRR